MVTSWHCTVFLDGLDGDYKVGHFSQITLRDVTEGNGKMMAMNLYSAFSINIFTCALQASDLWVRSDIIIFGLSGVNRDR